MAISVDYSSSPWLITIPKADLTLDTGTKYKLTVDTFWQLLRDYADSAESIVFPVIYSRIKATTSTPSITDVNDNYYSLQFEDGAYSVNVINGNTNIRDVEVKNTVSVNTNNTTGFIDPEFLEYGTYGGGVTIDVINGVAGVAYPIGTPGTPSNNISDTHSIADAFGFTDIFVIGPLTLGANDWSDGHIFKGFSPLTSSVTLLAGANVTDCEFWTMYITGEFDNNNVLRQCIIGDLDSYDGFFDRCAISGEITLGGATATTLVDCFTNEQGGTIPSIVVGSGSQLNLVRYSGEITIKDKTGTDKVDADFASGTLNIDATVVAGDIEVRGTCIVNDNSTGTTTVDVDGLTTLKSDFVQVPGLTAAAVWNHVKALTFQKFLGNN